MEDTRGDRVSAGAACEEDPRQGIAIEVVYAERDRQTLIALVVPVGSTAASAVERSGIRARHPGIAGDAPLGVHGRVVAPDHVLQPGDRVELYRPLPTDPKETRRRLAREGLTMGRRGAGRPER